MRSIHKISFGAVVMALLAFAACQKNNLSAPDDSTGAIIENARIDNESANLEYVVNAVALSQGIKLNGAKLDSGGIISLLPACATVTLDTVTDPHKLVIDFGTSPCLCDNWDNRYRQGVVTVTWTGGYKEPGTVIQYTTTNYQRGDAPDQMDQITFSKTVTNEGVNNSGNLHYHVVTTASMITFDGQTSNWSSDKDKEWMQGSSTTDRSDDVFFYTGTMSGTHANGVSYNDTIIDPLVKEDCDWFVSGKVEINRSAQPDSMILDYGNGVCDDQATLTANGQTKTITLH